jgi:predicted DNA-binding ribbon-helix-helix protein
MRHYLPLRNVRINGKRTNIRLEDALWTALKSLAAEDGRNVHDLCTDAAARFPGGGVTSAVRTYLVTRLVDGRTPADGRTPEDGAPATWPGSATHQLVQAFRSVPGRHGGGAALQSAATPQTFTVAAPQEDDQPSNIVRIHGLEHPARGLQLCLDQLRKEATAFQLPFVAYLISVASEAARQEALDVAS